MKNMHFGENFGCFRNYKNSTYQQRVEKTYQTMHANQSLPYVTRMKQRYCALKLGQMSVYDVFNLLENIHDESDPDNDLPQIEHAYQTAEAISNKFMTDETNIRENISLKSLFRQQEWNGLPSAKQMLFAQHDLRSFYPEITDWSWFPLTGFIHDLGKIMLLEAFGGLPQWSVVGDTYPVGCPFFRQMFFIRSTYSNSLRTTLNSTIQQKPAMAIITSIAALMRLK